MTGFMKRSTLGPMNAKGARPCLQCGATFTPTKLDAKHKGRYCSRACFQAMQAVKSVPCRECGQEFKPVDGQVYCSKPCHFAHKRRNTINLDAGTKRCGRCNEWKPLAAYHRHSRGHQHYCRDCGRAYELENRARRAEARRDAARRRYQANPEAARQRNRAYSARTRARKAERQREWRRRNPETVRLMNKARLHRQRAAGNVTRAVILQLRLLQKGKCAICRGSMAGFRNEHLDHIVPIVAGGTSDRHNLQLLCRHCNLRKHDADPIEFAQREGRLL